MAFDDNTCCHFKKIGDLPETERLHPGQIELRYWSKAKPSAMGQGLLVEIEPKRLQYRQVLVYDERGYAISPAWSDWKDVLEVQETVDEPA